jgi:flagellar protein FliJ
MAKFVFKLEGVLRQRKTAEQQKQRELANIQAKMEVLRAELRSMDLSVQTATEDVRRNRLTGPLDLSFLAAHRRYSFAMQRKAMELAQKMAVVQRDVDVAAAGFREAAKQRKVIEKLREKQMQRWREEASKRELAELEEVGLQMSYRRDAEDIEAERIKGDSSTIASDFDDRDANLPNLADPGFEDLAAAT